MAKNGNRGLVLRGKKWGYDIWHNGVRYNLTIGTKQEARTALDVLRGKLSGGVHVPGGKSGGRSTVQQFHDDVYRPHLDGGKGSKITAENDGYVLRRFSATYGERRLDSFTDVDFDQYSAARRKDVKDGTIGYELRRLRAFFALAVERGAIQSNPVKGKLIPKAGHRLYTLLKPGDESAFFAALPNDTARDLFKVAFHAALRRQDALGLRWSNVDLAHGTLSVIQPKTDEPKIIPLLPETLAILRARCPKDADPDGYVFTVRQGTPISENTWATWRGVAVRACKLRGLRPHDLRHSLAARLDARRVGVATIGKVLGHAFPYTTTARYTSHATQEQIRDALAEVVGQ